MSTLLASLLDCPGLRIEDVVLTPAATVALVAATALTADCPCCGTPSRRIHSRYRRTVADLPLQDRTVTLRLVVRRFRCTQPGCSQTIFCERLPGLLDAHARSTVRLSEAHRLLGFALGGEAGSRLAKQLEIPTSPDTLLRRVKSAAVEPAPPPRFIGVDDWATAKGQRYGTILVDLERGRVIDLLPGRDGEALKAWLKAHPGIEVITRDRWPAYAQAAIEGAPQARQVADRWHLLKNLRETIEQLLGGHSAPIRAALKELPAVAASAEKAAEAGAPTPPVEPPTAPSGLPTTKKQVRQLRQQERARQYDRVKELRTQNHSLRQIARATGLSLKCVIRYLRSDHCPDWNPGRKMPTQLDPFAEKIDAWVAQGNHNAADLYRELGSLGFRGSYDAVRRHLARRLGSTGRPGPRVGTLSPPATPGPPSARKLSFEVIRRPEERSAEERARLDKLRGCGEGLREALDLACEFAEMVRQRSEQSLASWLAKAQAAACAPVRNFAASLRTDQAAVGAALTDEWSNGPVEGQVNRLKWIKRSMFGRAGLDLLRARVRRTG